MDGFEANTSIHTCIEVNNIYIDRHRAQIHANIPTCMYACVMSRVPWHMKTNTHYVACWVSDSNPRFFDSGCAPIASNLLTHWGRMTHICVSKLTIIGSDNGLSPDRRQAIIWTNAELLLIGPWGTNLSEILIEILTFPFKKMRLKVSSVTRRPFCLGLIVLTKSTATTTKL